MQSRRKVARHYRSLSIANAVVFAVVLLCAVLLAMRLAGDNARRDIVSSARETLGVQTQVLAGVLEKHTLLSATIARRADVKALFAGAHAEDDRKGVAARIAAQMKGMSGALDVAFYYADGDMLAAGRGRYPQDVTPKSDMVRAPLQGRLGGQIAFFKDGTRAYIISSPVRGASGHVVGLVAVFVDLEALEATWSLSANAVYAATSSGRIIISNQADWRLQSEADIRRLHNGTVYTVKSGIEDAQLDVTRYLPVLDWQLHVLAKAAPIGQARLLWGGIVALGVLLIAIGVQATISVQATTTLKARSDRALALRLERIVRDRTAALQKSNESLRAEIAERHAAEDRLKKTQDELVQTGKLAALGQISASLSHELNQPLAATRSFAENALKYLDLGRTQDARDNVARISSLTERMADISRHLRNFARRPNPGFGVASVQKALEDAQSLLGGRITDAKARITVTGELEGVFVRGGPVRLTQIFVNLIANALDAMEANEAPAIEIFVSRANETIAIGVRDFGPGIAEHARASIFDPFFTTKGVGQGLGLGLSISYNIVKDFGGRIIADNHPEGGAVFIVELDQAEPMAGEAAQ